ncbi:MAG TPA: lycopene beta-cyclase CrtY [Ramlibacter sp.]|jgi:lycopene beta-cyclase|uniref:lycopene beta-cyclase CrtY n=1 Tax=Ramlibacter sp. TaxID=1917967 RepID=UPI002D3EE809|nr:lycopene beta-cyclase CrtY [Ramlibacter sp.]HZY19007.1 lycopene beta-cyclase CrtY [Ramlibacter sp.]
MTRRDADLLLVGGGLANGLIAWRLRQCRPELRVLVLEAGPALGGNHTWSFHDGDLTLAQRHWIAPLVGWRWPGYDVHFPGLHRRLDGGYASIASDHFDRALRDALGDTVQLGARVAGVAPTEVRLEDGRVLHAGAVIDGRGVPPRTHLDLGFQKFHGQVLRLARPHGLAVPILMDATVDQQDGYRFVYSLPLDPCTVLVEETFYSDGERLALDSLRESVRRYAASKGWQVVGTLREEHGVLPIALDGDPEALWADAGGVPRSGLAAALFHPTTGYSLPEAVRLADLVAAQADLSVAPLFAAMRAHALQRWRDQTFFRLLNRMLFRAARPAERRRVMQRFYGLPSGLIARFYASRSTGLDKARLLVGKPPVPVGAACRVAFPARRGPPAASRELPRAARDALPRTEPAE